MPTVQVIGLGMSPEDLTPKARKLIDTAEVLIGGRRLLAYFPDHPGRKIPVGAHPAEVLSQLPLLAKDKRVVVLASGDPNFYGLGSLVVKILGPEQVVIHPNITAVQAACARLRLSWHDAAVVSLHGRTWEPLDEALSRAAKIIIYTDPHHTPAAVARRLLEQGLSQVRLCVLENLGQDQETLAWYSPAQAAALHFAPLNVVVVLKEAFLSHGPDPLSVPGDRQAGLPSAAPPKAPLHLGLPEESLLHTQGLITKLEVRAVVLAKLRLLPGQVLWDLGAGSGSVAVEASLLNPGGLIVAVEQVPERAAQIRSNQERFGVTHLKVVCGRAPECLADLPDPHRVFVGGGGDTLADFLPVVLARLPADGRLVLTATMLETLETARRLIARHGWEMEIVHLQVSRSRPLGAGTYLKALNPVWILTAWPAHRQAAAAS